MKKQKINLPEKLLAFPNKDKDFHEAWHANRDLCNKPHPFRCILASPPNSGKSTVIKNMIVRADPPFQQIILISPDPKFSKEYEDIACVSLTECPPADQFPGTCKTLVVLDDMEFKSMNKDQAKNVDRLFGYVSTHKNVSICLAVQDPIQCPKSARRTSNVFILGRSPDVSATATLAKKVGMNAKHLQELFDRCEEHYDAIWIDDTKGAPIKIAMNCYLKLD